MARMSKEELARRDGIAYAHRLVKEQGLEALEEDMRRRNITDCPVGIGKADMDKFANNVRENVIDTFLIINAAVLRDEFGFGEQRLARFIERFNLKAAVLSEDYANWDDYIQILREEVGLELTIRENNRNVVIKQK